MASTSLRFLAHLVCSALLESSLCPYCAVRAVGAAGTVYINCLGEVERRKTGSNILDHSSSPSVLLVFHHQGAIADRRTSLRPHLQRYASPFISYVDELKPKWDGIQTAQELAYGISLAVDVVRTLRGPVKVGCDLEQKEGGEPLWIQLK